MAYFTVLAPPYGLFDCMDIAVGTAVWVLCVPCVLVICCERYNWEQTGGN